MLFVDTSIIHHSSEGVLILCNILDLLIYSYKLKKQAVEYLGYYFYEIVLPQARSKRWKPSLDESEEY